MSLSEAPRSSKWPYLLADVALVAAAGWLGWHAAPAWTWKEMAAVGGLFGLGAWIFVQPFQRDHEAAVKLWEQSHLASAAQQLGSLDAVARQIATATAQWQQIQETSGKTVGTAGEIARQITAEAKGFTDFLNRSNDAEKAAMRLELEKLRRGEQDVIQVILVLLDHCFALFQAAVNSGQPQLIQQLGHYRAACLDTVRRIGLVSHEAQAGEPFDPQRHQAADGTEPAPGSRIAGTVAPGYSLQGSGVRRIVVVVEGQPVSEEPPGTEDSASLPGPA
jgi:molecular chaperone GrpE (heat shock protein)